MPRLANKIILSLLLLSMSGSLFWYALCTNRIAARDTHFIRGPASLGLFPEASYRRGVQAYYDEMDPAEASRSFREAIGAQPLLIDAWLSLVKVELAQDQTEEAERIFDTIEPALDHVSTWKWQELLLSFELEDEAKMDSIFNFILARLPQRVTEAFQVAFRHWEGYGSILPHLSPENRVVGLNELMRAKAVDESLALWEQMKETSPTPDQGLSNRFCEFLLNNGRVAAAKEIWKNNPPDDWAGVDDGGFERPPLNMAFGWRIGRNPDVEVNRSRIGCYQGSSCLHLHFRGSKNISFGHVVQVMPAEPGQNLRLRFARKSRNLSTDQGVFIQVGGYRCSGLNVQSTPMRGTQPWEVEVLDVPVPEGCEAVIVQVRRKESLMFDNKISGDYWLDAVTSEVINPSSDAAH